jgi:hypothetical protein
MARAAIFRPRARRHFIFFLGQPEQNDRQHSERARLTHFLHGLVYRKVENPGHRADFFPDARSGANEQWIHQRFRSKPGLADEGTKRFGAPQTAKAVSGEGHDSQF